MTAVDHPELVRAVVMVASAAKTYPAGFSGAKEQPDAVVDAILAWIGKLPR
jgi:pimeloyl-ACP methyl ester carboxylesterase